MNVTIGGRMLKTGIAAALALYIAKLLQIESEVLAGISAVFAVQPSVYRSWQHALEQVQANTLGAALAYGVSFVLPVNEVVVGLTCVAVIAIVLAVHKESAVTLTLVTTIIIMHAGGELAFALERFAAIMIGIGAAFAVNVLVLPPNYRRQFLEMYRNALNALSLLLRTAVSYELKEGEVKSQREKLDALIRKLNDDYGTLEEEWRKWKRFRKRQSGRHVVIDKQMVKVLAIGVQVLDALEHRVKFRDEETLAQRLEELIHYHEYTLLKYEGKVRHRESQYAEQVERQAKKLLLDEIHQGDEGEERISRILLASLMVNYGKQLKRLDHMLEHEKPTE